MVQWPELKLRSLWQGWMAALVSDRKKTYDTWKTAVDRLYIPRTGGKQYWSMADVGECMLTIRGEDARSEASLLPVLQDVEIWGTSYH
jgi:hypothetical protein